MGNVSDTAISFLEDGGKSLGFDENTLPRLEDIATILMHSIKVWEYNGMTEREYYGG